MLTRFQFLTILISASLVSGAAESLCAQVGSSDVSAAGKWYVTTRDGQKILPRTLNITSEGWLLTRGDDVQRLATVDLLSVMNTDAAAPEDFSRKTISRLYLSNGDRLVGQLAALSEAGLELKPLAVYAETESEVPASGERSNDANDAGDGASTVLKIPIESVRALEWIPPGTLPHQLKLLTVEESAKQDILRLSNGDQLSGELTTIALDTLTFRDDQGTRTIPTSEIRAVVFNPELVLEPPAVADYSRVALSDGTLLTVTSLSLLDFNHFELQTVLAGKYQVPRNMLVSLCTFSKNRQPLSLRTPSDVKYTPFLATVPHWQADRNVQGAAMQMSGGRYLTGIGVHSRTELTWTLEENDLRFLADIGIDDSTQGRGCVTFSVLLDGDVDFESGPVRGGDLPQTIDIDLAGRKTLTLLVDFGAGGDVLDRANWGHAVIVKEKLETGD